MNKKDSIQKIKEIVKPYIQNAEAFENLTEETNFITDLKINSANLVDVVLDIEDEFDIVMENEDMEKMITVKDALQVVQGKIES